jgi:hypothetical protein
LLDTCFQLIQATDIDKVMLIRLVYLGMPRLRLEIKQADLIRLFEIIVVQ